VAKKMYIAVAVVMNTTAYYDIQIWHLSQQSGMLPLEHHDLNASKK